MFQHSYQSGGYLEVFHTKTDKEKDKTYEKLYRVVNAAGFKKVYDKQTKGYIYEMDGMRTSLHFPNSEKQDLGLIQPFLVLQVFLPLGSPFSVEITITDTLKNKRRLHFSTSIRQIEKNYFHAKIPLDVLKRGVWTNLSFDVLSFFELFKGQTFRSLDAFTVGAVCKLRRIYTMRSPITDYSAEEEFANSQIDAKIVPKTQNFPPGVDYTNQLITLDLIKAHYDAAAGLQPEESMIEDNSVSQGIKTRVNPVATATKQPIGSINTKKDINQSFKSPNIRTKAMPANKEKASKPLESTERTDLASRGKENIRENVGIIASEKRKVGNIPSRRTGLGLNNKPSNNARNEFDDEKISTNVPKPHAQEGKSIRLTETTLNQEELERSSPEFPAVSDIPTSRDDHEEQKRDSNYNFGDSIRSNTRDSETKISARNPWSSNYTASNSRKNVLKVDPRENTVSSSTMDTRKDLENTEATSRLEGTKASEARSGISNDENSLNREREDAEFASIWNRVMGGEQTSVSNNKSPAAWDNAFETKDIRKFSPLYEKEEDKEVEGGEEDREKEEKEKERFGTMNWEFTRKSSDEDEIESVEEDLAFEIEEKIAMRDDKEGFGTQWKRQEFKTKTGDDINREKEGKNIKGDTYTGGSIAEGNLTQGSAQGNNSNTGKSIWETDQRRSLSEFEIKWKDNEHNNRDDNSLVIQEDGSREENELEDSLEMEMMVNEYVKKLDTDEKSAQDNKKKKNTKRAGSQIEDQMQDMVSKVRPYSPPFGQTLTSADENHGATRNKWCLEGVKTMKSSEEEEDDRDVKDKEEMEVVYDPVWKCYYDPKTNSYFELK